MLQEKVNHQDHPSATDAIDVERLKRELLDNGYVVLRGMIDRQRLAEHTAQLFDEFDRLNNDGPLFSGGGGMIMGHLNCFPGQQTRFVYETLEQRGIIDLIRSLWPKAARMPNVGCNFNLPGSSAQNYHMDGYAADAFPIINIASVDTDQVNGSLDVLERTHLRPYRYWEIVAQRPRSIRLPLSQGDVMIRSSMLWHRGMPNRSSRARPMLALTWEDGGSSLADPYTKNEGKLTFYPNRYTTNWVGRCKEHAYVLAPRLGATARFAVSLFKE